ncbi:MAG TPA: hypothetical protein P5262_00535 [Candidatus Moranbacteria bacterium]|nr:hypothetical protein [Candidatus Moranbacteria bacterium]
MEQEILEKFKKQSKKLDEIYSSVERTRKYFLWTLIATIVAFILPLLGLVVAIPWFLKTMTSAYGL